LNTSDSLIFRNSTPLELEGEIFYYSNQNNNDFYKVCDQQEGFKARAANLTISENKNIKKVTAKLINNKCQP